MRTQENYLSDELEHIEPENSRLNSKERLKRYEDALRDYFILQSSAHVQRTLMDMYRVYAQHSGATDAKMNGDAEVITTLMQMHTSIEMTYILKRPGHASKVSKH